MNMKKIIAAFCAAFMFLQTSVFADVSDQYKYFDVMSNFIAGTYIDEQYSKDDIQKMGLDKYFAEHPQAMVEVLKAACESLDPYSEFYTAEEFDAYLQEINSSFYGIGVVIREEDGYVTVMSCQEGSNAEAAGFQPNDRIIRVDGADVTGMSTDKVRLKIIGEKDTPVTVTVLRGDREIDYTVMRGEVRSDTVSWKELAGGIAYVQMTNFASTTDAEFAKVLEEIDKAGIKKVILDLRNNPGGYLTSAVNIAGMLVPEGVIVKTEFRQSEENEVFNSDLKETKYDLKVLVNGNSASSSEILASAVQDSGAGKIYGEQTYGKAVIQQMYRLTGGNAVKLTVGRYITRNGNEINHMGITPDEYVTNGKKPVDMSRYTKFDYQTVCGTGDTHTNVRAAKERLRGMGYNPGISGDTLTQETADAIALFQHDTGLYSYGVLDKTTQVRLENEFCKLDEMIDTQFETAYADFGGKIEDLYRN